MDRIAPERQFDQNRYPSSYEGTKTLESRPVPSQGHARTKVAPCAENRYLYHAHIYGQWHECHVTGVIAGGMVRCEDINPPVAPKVTAVSVM